jgi:MFS family permease
MILLEAPLMIALGLHPQVVLLVALAFAAGIGIETFAVAWDVAMQSNVPEDKLSRVYAYDWFGSLVFIPVGQMLAGPLAAGVGIREAIVGCGVVVLLATLAALSVPSVRNLRRAEIPDEVAAGV